MPTSQKQRACLQTAAIELPPRTPGRDDSLALFRIVSRHLIHSSTVLDPTTATIEIIHASLEAMADKSFSIPFQRRYAIRLPMMNFQTFMELVSAEYGRLIHTKTTVYELSEYLVNKGTAIRDTALLGTVSPPLVEPSLHELLDRDKFPSALAD